MVFRHITAGEEQQRRQGTHQAKAGPLTHEAKARRGLGKCQGIHGRGRVVSMTTVHSKDAAASRCQKGDEATILQARKVRLHLLNTHGQYEGKGRCVGSNKRGGGCLEAPRTQKEKANCEGEPQQIR